MKVDGRRDGPAGLDRDPRHGDAEARRTRGRRSRPARRRARPAASGRAGSCRRRRSRRRGRARAARGPSSRESWACRPMIRCAATSKPEVSKIWLPMWECSPRRSSHCSCSRTRSTALRACAAGERQPELLVLVGGRDVLVGVRLDADGDPQQHRHATAVPAPGLGHPGDLVDAVDDDPADAGRHRPVDLGIALVVAVQADSLRRHPRPQGDRQLAAAAGVDRQPVLDHPARDGGAEERLARVVDVGVAVEGDVNASRKATARARRSASSRTYAGVPNSCGEVAHVDAADPQRAVVVAPHRGRPEPRHQRVDVVRVLQPGRPAHGPRVQRTRLVRRHPYIRSGAETPSRPRPFATT